MPKSKIRNAISVEVEIEDQRAEISDPTWYAEREQEAERRRKDKIELGLWWDALAGLVLVVGLCSIFLTNGNIGTKTDIYASLVFLTSGVIFSGVYGKLHGKETRARLLMGWSFWAVGLGLVCCSLLFRENPTWSRLLCLGLVFAAIGWALRRLIGESFVRALSIGLVLILPFLVLDGTILLKEVLEGMKDFINQTTLWYAGVFADIWSIPFFPIEGGIRFSGGDIKDSGAFDNFAGILTFVCLSVSLSLALRQSLLVAAINAFVATTWWFVFRGLTCLGIADDNLPENYLSTQALSPLMFCILAMVVSASNLGLGAILGPIPISSSEDLELARLTVIYNALVSFPQLGPSTIAFDQTSNAFDPDQYDDDED
jgi:hypothetical protein